MILEETLSADHYRSIAKPGDGFYREKGSKFLGFTFRVSSELEAEEALNNLKKEYHDARHVCFAYRIGTDKPMVRYSDDGEPHNSAGMPIFNQLRAHELWNTLIAVVRYFGGTKLGVSGLIQAYKEASVEAISHSKISTEYIMETLKLRFPYHQMNEVMRLLKDSDAELIKEEMAEDAGYLIGIRKGQHQDLLQRLGQNHHIQVS